MKKLILLFILTTTSFIVEAKLLSEQSFFFGHSNNDEIAPVFKSAREARLWWDFLNQISNKEQYQLGAEDGVLHCWAKNPESAFAHVRCEFSVDVSLVKETKEGVSVEFGGHMADVFWDTLPVTIQHHREGAYLFKRMANLTCRISSVPTTPLMPLCIFERMQPL